MKKAFKNFFMVLIAIFVAVVMVWSFRVQTGDAEALFEKVETSEGVEWIEKTDY
jgi:hypothetical protein